MIVMVLVLVMASKAVAAAVPAAGYQSRGNLPSCNPIPGGKGLGKMARRRR